MSLEGITRRSLLLGGLGLGAGFLLKGDSKRGENSSLGDIEWEIIQAADEADLLWMSGRHLNWKKLDSDGHPDARYRQFSEEDYIDLLLGELTKLENPYTTLALEQNAKEGGINVQGIVNDYLIGSVDRDEVWQGVMRSKGVLEVVDGKVYMEEECETMLSKFANKKNLSENDARSFWFEMLDSYTNELVYMIKIAKKHGMDVVLYDDRYSSERDKQMITNLTPYLENKNSKVLVIGGPDHMRKNNSPRLINYVEESGYNPVMVEMGQRKLDSTVTTFIATNPEFKVVPEDRLR